MEPVSVPSYAHILLASIIPGLLKNTREVTYNKFRGLKEAMYIESILTEQSHRKLVDNNICKYTTLCSMFSKLDINGPKYHELQRSGSASG